MVFIVMDKLKSQNAITRLALACPENHNPLLHGPAVMPTRNYSLHVLLAVGAWLQHFSSPSRLSNKILIFLYFPGSSQRIYSIRSLITNASLVALPR